MPKQVPSEAQGVPGPGWPAWAALRGNRSLLRIVANGGWMMAEQVVRLVVGLALSVWLARHLGPSDFGELSYALSFASIFGVIASLGLNRILVRELVAASGQPTLVDRLMTTALGMRLAAACLTYAVCVASAWLLDARQLLLVGLVAAGFFFSAADCVDIFFQARGEAGSSAKARLLAFLAVAVVRAGLLLAGADLIAFAAVALLELGASALALQLLYRHRGGGFAADRFDPALAFKLLKESWPEVIAGFAGLLFVRIDQIMLAHMLGPGAVGAFAAATRLSEAWYFVPAAFVAASFPSIVALRESDARRFLDRLQLLMTVLCVVCYAAAIAITVIAQPLVAVLLGAAYADSAPILLVHVWSGLFVSLGLASGAWIVAEKRIWLNLARNAVGLACNVLLNYLLIARWGPVGAAWATLLSLFVAYVLFDAFVPAMHEIGRRKLRALLIWPLIRLA